METGKGLLAPLGKGVHEALVDKVVFVLKLLRAARDGESLGAVECEVRIQRDSHAEGIVADAQVCAGGGTVMRIMGS